LPFSNSAGADQGDEVGCVHRSPAGLGGLMSLNVMATPAALEPGPLVSRCRSLTVAKVDSMGLVDGVGNRYEGVDAAGPAGLSPLAGSGWSVYGATVRDKGRRE
jgi:hypothetical protein